jgi:sugar lactone lactonase YvrE
MIKRRLLAIFAAVVGLALIYLLFWPVPAAPAAWTPPAPPALAGPYEQNTRLAAVERVGAGIGYAPEEPAFDGDGRLYTGLGDGRIMRLNVDGSHQELFANTGGRPLGMAFDGAVHLIVTDAVKGLLSIDRNGAITVLSTGADGRPFHCPNDLDIAADGTIYFTDASDRFPLTSYTHDIVEHQPNGRLLAYDPTTKTTRLVLDRLHFANGVAVSPDQTFVLVCETGMYRVLRVWLSGAKRGQVDTFIDNLPGFPDNIASNGRDKFWLALVTPRNPLLDKLMPHPFLRRIVLRLPQALQPAPERYGFVLGLNADGQVVDNLQDPAGHFAEISSALEHDGQLYFGSIGEDAIGRLRLSNGQQK